MTQVEIYTTPVCPFCYRAKALLESKGIPFTEIDVMTTTGKRDEMRSRAGGRNTVPQIFVDGQHIGGSDDLQRFARSGELDRLLAQAG